MPCLKGIYCVIPFQYATYLEFQVTNISKGNLVYCINLEVADQVDIYRSDH